MRRRLQDARIVVTGASSGIGRAVAEALGRKGARLLLTARRAERLAGVCCAIESEGGSASSLPGDIASSEHRRRLASWIDAHWGGLDGLVNAAGVGATGPFAEATESRLRRLMEVDFFAPVELIRCCLPALRSGRRPVVVNIVSVLGHRAVPNKSEYCAAKFALHGMTESLRSELPELGIDVVMVSPSTTATEFFDALTEKGVDEPKWKGRPMSAGRVARATLRAMERGRHEVVLSPSGRALVWLDRLCPPLADWVVMRWGK